MSDNEYNPNTPKARSRQRSNIAIKKQIQYIKNLSPEEQEVMYGKLHQTAEPVKPTTAKGKVSNYWYHYKWHTIGIAFVVLLVSFFVFEIVTREKYDMEIMMVTTFYVSDDEISILRDELNAYATDFDDNGKVNVGIMHVQYDMENVDTIDPNIHMANTTKLQGSLSDRTYSVYLVDQANYDFLSEELVTFQDLSDDFSNDNIEGDAYLLNSHPRFQSILGDQELYLVIRDQDLEKEKEIAAQDYQFSVLQNIINNTPVQN